MFAVKLYIDTMVKLYIEIIYRYNGQIIYSQIIYRYNGDTMVDFNKKSQI